MFFKKIIKILILPLKWLCLGLIYFYKFCISPLLPKCCAYAPTCSTYMLLSIKEFGVFKGIILGIKRLLRCTPHCCGGVDPVPVNIKGDNKWVL